MTYVSKEMSLKHNKIIFTLKKYSIPVDLIIFMNQPEYLKVLKNRSNGLNSNNKSSSGFQSFDPSISSEIRQNPKNYSNQNREEFDFQNLNISQDPDMRRPNYQYIDYEPEKNLNRSPKRSLEHYQSRPNQNRRTSPNSRKDADFIMSSPRKGQPFQEIQFSNSPIHHSTQHEPQFQYSTEYLLQTIQDLRNENMSLKQELKKVRSQKSNHQNTKELFELNGQIITLRQALEEKDQIIESKNREISELEEQYDQIYSDYERMVHYMSQQNLLLQKSYQSHNSQDKPIIQIQQQQNVSKSTYVPRAAMRDNLSFHEQSPKPQIQSIDYQNIYDIDEIERLLNPLLDQRNLFQQKLNKAPPKGGRDQIVQYRAEQEQYEENIKKITSQIAKLQFRKKQLLSFQ